MSNKTQAVTEPVKKEQNSMKELVKKEAIVSCITCTECGGEGNNIKVYPIDAHFVLNQHRHMIAPFSVDGIEKEISRLSFFGNNVSCSCGASFEITTIMKRR